MGTNSNDMLTYRELSDRWKIPVSTLRVYVMQGSLTPIKIRRHVRFPLDYIKKIETEGLK
jgi:predicted site-specific integrase-resolvase